MLHSIVLRSVWRIVLFLIAFMLLMPLFSLVLAWNQIDFALWQHIQDYLLADMLRQSLALILLVTVFSTLLGLPLAWATVHVDFWGRRALIWLLMLPMAIPAYVMATLWLGWFSYDSALNQIWFAILGWRLQLNPILGAAIVLSLSLYPYIFFTLRAAFINQAPEYNQAAQSLGFNARQRWFKVTLPLAKPALLTALMLVWMETLADFGVVALFNVNTFSNVIYKVWFGLYSVPTALQLASILFVLVVLLLLIKQQWQSLQQLGRLQHRVSPHQPAAAQGFWRWLWPIIGYSVFALAFIVPLITLILHVFSMQHVWDARTVTFAFNSLKLSLMGSAVIVVLALLMLLYQRFYQPKFYRMLAVTQNTGYAIPGAVLAIAWYAAMVAFENYLYDNGITLAITGSLFLVLVAYACRFMAVAYEPLENALQRMPKSLDHACASLAVSAWRRVYAVYLPLLKLPVLTATLLVFVELVKELPMTLMTRPFGYETLAIRVFEMANDGNWTAVALPSLCIIAVGLLPIYLLVRGMRVA